MRLTRGITIKLMLAKNFKKTPVRGDCWGDRCETLVWFEPYQETICTSSKYAKGKQNILEKFRKIRPFRQMNIDLFYFAYLKSYVGFPDAACSVKYDQNLQSLVNKTPDVMKAGNAMQPTPEAIFCRLPVGFRANELALQLLRLRSNQETMNSKFSKHGWRYIQKHRILDTRHFDR